MRQGIVSMRAEVANVVDVVGGLAGAVSSLIKDVDSAECVLRHLRHGIAIREGLIGDAAERVRAMEEVMRVSRNWQSHADVAIKSILKKVG